MPLGSSSLAPVMSPGPRIFNTPNTRTIGPRRAACVTGSGIAADAQFLRSARTGRMRSGSVQGVTKHDQRVRLQRYLVALVMRRRSTVTLGVIRIHDERPAASPS